MMVISALYLILMIASYLSITLLIRIPIKQIQ